uniref:Uncharacterized protein At2g22700 n=1 Tax=Arabidopsis thaliana TaxID=3702 RepID=Q9ZQ44_ARATH|nr:hypothetical protein [Arabidopsis thaliana]
MFGSPYFKNLFLTRSSAKPRLLFALVEKGDVKEESCGVWSFFSSLQLDNLYEESSSTLVAAAEFHGKFSPNNHYVNLKKSHVATPLVTKLASQDYTNLTKGLFSDFVMDVRPSPTLGSVEILQSLC